MILFFIFGSILQMLTKCKCGRNLLLKYPRFFTYGFFSHQGPSEEAMNVSYFEFNVFGEGKNIKTNEIVKKNL